MFNVRKSFKELQLNMYINQPLLSHWKQCELLLFLCRVARLLCGANHEIFMVSLHPILFQ